MGEIKAVSFDIGGTLAKGELNTKLYRARVVNYLRSQEFEVEPKDLSRATGLALEELRLKREQRLELRFEEFCSLILKALGITPSDKLVKGVRSLYYECFPQTVRRGVREVLTELSRENRLAAISNSMSLVPKRFLDESGLSKYFDAIVISGEVGYRKPHPAIFEAMLEQLGVKPSEAVHVGNLIEEDVGGAKGVGMYAVLLAPSAIGEVETWPDLVVPSILEVPEAIATLASPRLREIKELLGDVCGLCSTRGVGLYKLDPKGEEGVENFAPLCPSCYKETLKKPPRPRKRGKYRAVYRKAWLEIRKPKRWPRTSR